MWLLLALLHFQPVAVFLKRLEAPLWVFNLLMECITPHLSAITGDTVSYYESLTDSDFLLFYRCQNHNDLATFHLGVLLDDTVILKILADTANELHAKMLMGEFTATESQ